MVHCSNLPCSLVGKRLIDASEYLLYQRRNYEHRSKASAPGTIGVRFRPRWDRGGVFEFGNAEIKAFTINGLIPEPLTPKPEVKPLLIPRPQQHPRPLRTLLPLCPSFLPIRPSAHLRLPAQSQLWQRMASKNIRIGM